MKSKSILSFILALLMLVSACLVAVSAEETLYTDVKSKRWSYKDIMYVSEKGLMNGKSEGIFAPAETMTRAMVVTVFYRLAGSPAVEYAATFTDVKANKWFTDAVIWASNNGIVNGTGDAKYEPMANVTREQLATIIMRYAQFAYIKTEKTVDITGYADYKRIHDYAREAMAWANAEGLITGKTEDTLAPREGATREQFAAILHRFDTAEFDYELVYNTPVYGQNYKTPEYELVTDADIYVAVDGDDNNPGTLDKPIATFERARDMVREMDKTGRDGIKVAFKAGNYGSLDISFAKNDSGTAECPITYCAYGDGDVVFMNGIELYGSDFAPIDESDYYLFPEGMRAKIFKLNVADIMTPEILKNALVMVGDTLCQTARYPNGDIDTTMGQKYADDALKYLPVLKKRFDSWHTLEGVTIEGNIIIDYEFNVFPVISYDSENVVMTFDMGGKVFPADDAAYWAMKPHQFCNVSEELDDRYEYFLNEDNMCLYVYGDAPADVYSITTGGQFISIGDGYTDGVSHISFDGFDFKYCAETAIRTSHVSKNVSLKNLDIYAVNGRGIHLNGDGCSVENCTVDMFTGEGIYCYGSNLTVKNNLVCHGDVGIYAAGVTEVSHNEIYDMTDSAIYYADCPITIEYNVMHDCCLEGSDKGFIYNGRSWVQVGGVIRYNLFYSTDNCAGMFIYLDDGLSNQEVYGNLFFGGMSQGIRVNGGRNNDIYENVFIKRDRDDGVLLSLGAKYSEMFDENGNPTGTLPELVNTLNERPEQGSEKYKLWEEKWPEALKINTNWADRETDPDCGANAAYNVVKDNYSFVGKKNNEHSVDEPHFTRFSTVENNPVFGIDVNYLFVNPALGDYRIREDAGDSKISKLPYIPFAEMGRQ
ncbi:MAG: S-layer homology domain-containing protein [Clostridia bacterium]|nr:S-layer homology domain-containing protein [Clostridia bacterium]